MLLPSRNAKVTISRILKVNHAGEAAAVNIYGAQIALARRRFPHVIPALEDMRRDEIEHRRLFREAMPAHDTRPCGVMRFWSLGGYVLGGATALIGEKMVWICTEAVEATVHEHLEEQTAFLHRRDPGLRDLIQSIQAQELSHLQHAERAAGSGGWQRRFGYPVIATVTKLMIWLSTWGDTSWMRAEMQDGSRNGASPK